MERNATDERIKEAVRDAYGGIARRYVEEPQRASCCGPSQPAACCGPSAATVDTSEAATRLYSAEEMVVEGASFDPASEVPPADWVDKLGLFTDLNEPVAVDLDDA